MNPLADFPIQTVWDWLFREYDLIVLRFDDGQKVRFHTTPATILAGAYLVWRRKRRA